jgi:DNA-binding NarL/FixJ family response regulator
VTGLRIVVADDSAVLRQMVTLVLRRGGHTVSDVDHPDKLLAAVAESAPDLCVIDVRMPPTHTVEGIRAAREIRDSQPGTATVVVSQRLEVQHLPELLPGGGLGYLLKDRIADVTGFLGLVARVAAGGVAVDPEIVDALLRATGRVCEDPTDHALCAAVAEGLPDAAVAQRLGVPVAEVPARVAALFDVLGVAGDPADPARARPLLALLSAQWTPVR